MLYIKSDGTVRLTRGDTARLTVPITNETDDSTYEVQDGDTLTMTVKKSCNDETPSFQKVVTGANTFHIEPKDTADMSFGKYKYDVELVTAAGDVHTVIEPTDFEVMQEVTY